MASEPCDCGRPLVRRPFMGKVVTSTIHCRTPKCEEWERKHPPLRAPVRTEKGWR